MQGMKSSSRKRGLGGAEGRYKRVGVDERRSVGRSGVTAGKRRHDLHWSGVSERGDPQLMGPALLPLWRTGLVLGHRAELIAVPLQARTEQIQLVPLKEAVFARTEVCTSFTRLVFPNVSIKALTRSEEVRRENLWSCAAPVCLAGAYLVSSQ